MLGFLILMVVLTLVAVGIYQWVINKYYWGPKGNPESRGQIAEVKRKDSEETTQNEAPGNSEAQ